MTEQSLSDWYDSASKLGLWLSVLQANFGQNHLTEHQHRRWRSLMPPYNDPLGIYAMIAGNRYYWADVCSRTENPFITLPCNKFTVLDCFAEVRD